MSRLREIFNNNPGDPTAIAHTGVQPQAVRVAFNVVGSWTFFSSPILAQITAFCRSEMETVGAKGKKETYEGVTLLTMFGHEIDLSPEDSEQWLTWFEGVSGVQRVQPVSADLMPPPPRE
jgi:hypothetical protein